MARRRGKKYCITCCTALRHKDLSRCVPCAVRNRENQRNHDNSVRRYYGAKSYQAEGV